MSDLKPFISDEQIKLARGRIAMGYAGWALVDFTDAQIETIQNSARSTNVICASEQILDAIMHWHNKGDGRERLMYAAFVYRELQIKEDMQSKISLLERTCATLTKERDEARKEAEGMRSYALSIATEEFNDSFPWEDKTDE